MPARRVKTHLDYPLDESALRHAERELFGSIAAADQRAFEKQLPASIQLSFDVDELAMCFTLCDALWRRGFDREALIALTRTLLRDGDVGEADRLTFKRLRAKFKHLRFAHALYGASHSFPMMLNLITVTMGHLQDAYRLGRRGAVRRYAFVLRLLLTEPAMRYLNRELSRLTLTSSGSFRNLLLDDVEELARFVESRTVTGRRLHRARKIIGRQRSFWDTLRTVAPTSDRCDIALALATINTLMGDLHDRLVEHRARGSASYSARLDLPGDIRRRIAGLVRRLRESVAGEAGVRLAATIET